jgi:hypothetical protein
MRTVADASRSDRIFRRVRPPMARPQRGVDQPTRSVRVGARRSLALLLGSLAVAGGSGAVVVIGTAQAGATCSPWYGLASVNPSRTNDSLLSVSCVDSADCMAVGSYASAPRHLTLVESWDGTAWSVIPSPNPGTGTDVLKAVSCITSLSDCMAVGSYGTGGPVDTLIESWDGTSWTVIPSPNVGSTNNNLDALSCSDATACIAVGNDTDSLTAAPQTLIESWDGTSWSVVSSPNEGGSNYLNGVDCTSPSSCTAVGANIDGSALSTLVESWDGTSWNVVPSPNPGYGGTLLGVNCTTASNCMAVGAYTYSDNDVVTLAESWNGSSWSVVASPGTFDSGLTGVSCTGPTTCLGVGSSNLVESWDGTAWSVVPNDDPDMGAASAVSCVDTASCVGVGTYPKSRKKSLTLVETNIPPPPPEITSVKPASGKVGARVTIRGTELAGATAVDFNGTGARLITDTSSKITTTVPTGATSGSIEVTTLGGTATSPKTFTVP